MKYTPPRWADRFLEWYCRPELLDEIQGDAYEIFLREAKVNVKKAKLHYVWNVFRFFRFRNISKTRFNTNNISSISMIKSFIVTGIRNMMRNTVPSLINIVGLSVAIGCAILVFILEDTYYNLDAMHENHENIALVSNLVKEGDNVKKHARSPYPLASLLTENSAVDKTARVSVGNAAVRVSDVVFQEALYFTDPDFLNIFSFKVLAGNRQCLNNKGELIITEDIAVKYFGNKDVVGQMLSLKFNDHFKQEFAVGAIIENTPANSSMYFDFLVPMAVWEDMNRDDVSNWSKNTAVTFVSVKTGHHFTELDPTFLEFKKIQNQADPIRAVQTTSYIPLMDIAHQSYDIHGSLSWSNAPVSMIAIALIGLFLITLACFNYMNVAVASVSTRLKEIGIRKVVGGGKGKIIQQFLIENLVLCFISFVIGLGLAYFFFVPGFDTLFPIRLEFELSSWKMILGFFGGLLAFVSLVSGAYPAVYVASFNAVHILRGKEKFGNRSMFSKILLTAQFTLSITTMVACLIFVWASGYLERKDWGYDRDQIAVAKIQRADQFEAMRKAFESNRTILSYAGAVHHIGKSYENVVIRYEQDAYAATRFAIGFNYLEAMNIRLKSGRMFDEDAESDKGESVIVNETFVKKMGWTNPLKESFTLDSIKRFVIGVTEDFNYNDFYAKVEPVVFTIAKEKDFQYVVAKSEQANVDRTMESLRQEWKRTAPDDPFDGFKQSEVMDFFITNLHANNIVILFTSGIALLLAAMGLYGLISYNLTRRLKEFSVRKVFGADVLQIFKLMGSDYQWILIIAIVIGAPLGSYLMNQMVDAIYPHKIPRTISPYLISISVIVVTVACTIGTQLRRVVVENPSETLRIE